MSSRKFDINEAYLQALQESVNEPNKLYGEWIDLLDMIPSDDLDNYVVEYDITDAELNGSAKPSDERLKELIDGADYILHNKVFGESKKLNEEFTVDTFNNKYKPLYNNSVEVDGDKVSVDNITLRGSGMSKKVGATLKGNNLQIDNEFIGISYDGNNISVNGQYWFTSDFENNEEFNAKVTKAVKELYNDMKKLQQDVPEEKEEPKTIPIHNEVDLDEVIAMFREMVKDNPNNEKAKEFLRKYDSEFTESKKIEDKEKLDERKKYWDPEYKEYDEDGHKFIFKCIYYEVSGSSQASLWGHEVYLIVDGKEVSYNKIPYYNRTWESFTYQSCMLGAIGNYLEEIEKNLLSDARIQNNVRAIKKDQKEEILANDKWYQTVKAVKTRIGNGDSGNRLTEDYIRTNLASSSMSWNPQKLNVTLNTARQTLQDLDEFEDAAETLCYSDGISDEFNDKLDEFIDEVEQPEYDRIEKEVNRVEQEEIDKSKQPPKKTRKKKTEDIDDVDDEDIEEDDPYGETVSLFARAYREVPEVGVEEWGKDDEYYFCLDTKKFLADLEGYEVEIPKKLVDEASYDDWSNGIDEYLETFLGIDPDDSESDNTYNWGSRLTHDLNLNFYDTDSGFYVAIEIHKSGDVRGNYTTRFLLRFDDREDWYEACYEAQANNTNTIELDGKHYRIEPDFWSEHCNIWCEEDNNGWDEVYCGNKEELQNLIASEEPMY